jgi:hypothetical protein
LVKRKKAKVTMKKEFVRLYDKKLGAIYDKMFVIRKGGRKVGGSFTKSRAMKIKRRVSK